jgi:hypothetical protein
MAIGTTEIVTGFDNDLDISASGPKVGRSVSACGICGAVIFPGLEVQHETWHDLASWTRVPAATTVIRNARSPFEANSP